MLGSLILSQLIAINIIFLTADKKGYKGRKYKEKKNNSIDKTKETKKYIRKKTSWVLLMPGSPTTKEAVNVDGFRTKAIS